MQILFTTRDEFFSNSIRAITKEDVSHVALKFNDWLVVHSNIKGVHLETYQSFKKRNNIINILQANNTYPAEVIRQAISKEENKPYGIVEFCVLPIRLLAQRYVPGLTLDLDYGDISGMYICTEIVQHLLDMDYGVITPGELREQLLESGDFYELGS